MFFQRVTEAPSDPETVWWCKQMEKGFQNSLSPWQEEPQQENFSDNKLPSKSPHKTLIGLVRDACEQMKTQLRKHLESSNPGERTPAPPAERQLHCDDLSSVQHSSLCCSCHTWWLSKAAALKWMPFQAHSRFGCYQWAQQGQQAAPPLFLYLNDIHGLCCLVSLAVQVVVATASWQWLVPAKKLWFNLAGKSILVTSPLLLLSKFNWTVKCQTR